MAKVKYIDSMNGKKFCAERAEYTKDGQNIDSALNSITNNTYTVTGGNKVSVTETSDGITISANITTGPQGPSGPVGNKGSDGPSGNQGVTGAKGPCGPVGAKGPCGPSGAKGPCGPQGNTGVTGAQGPCGPVGNKGPCGPSGNQGANNQGNQGVTGAKGPCGPSGNKGPCGPSGNQGTNNKGNQGVTGARLGPSGPSGAKGPCGPSGNPNPTTGPKGPCGPSGNQGITGAQGNTGVTGAAGGTGKFSSYVISNGFYNCDVSSATPTSSWTKVDTFTTDSNHAIYVLYWFYCNASSSTNTFQIDVDVYCTSGTGSDFTLRFPLQYGKSEATFMVFCPPSTTHSVDVKLVSGTARSCAFKYEIVSLTYR